MKKFYRYEFDSHSCHVGICHSFCGWFRSSKDISVISREGVREPAAPSSNCSESNKKMIKAKKSIWLPRKRSFPTSTNVVMSVASDPYAIGYISLGSLNDTVKHWRLTTRKLLPWRIFETAVTKIFRPFNVAYKGQLSAVAQDFVQFYYRCRRTGGCWSGGIYQESMKMRLDSLPPQILPEKLL